MQTKPVRSRKPLHLPTILDNSLGRANFATNLPAGWKKGGSLLALLAALSVSNAEETRALPIDAASASAVDQKSATDSGKRDTDHRRGVTVAPIFMAGSGEGATGCMVSSPPVFLSEHNAKAILKRAFENEGFNLDTAKSVLLAKRDISYFEYRRKKQLDTSFNLMSVGNLSETGFVVDFVSGGRFTDLDNHSRYSSVTYYDLISMTEELRKEYMISGQNNVAVFYDPMAMYFQDIENTDTITGIMKRDFFNVTDSDEDSAQIDTLDKSSFENNDTDAGDDKDVENSADVNEDDENYPALNETPQYKAASELSRKLLESQVRQFVRWFKSEYLPQINIKNQPR